MGVMYLGWPNRATLGQATVSGGDWLPARPATALLSREMTNVARSAGLANTYVDFDLGTARTLRAFAICNHNLTRAATWRITLGNAPGESDVFDSGDQLVWRINFDTGELEWEDNNWWAGNYDDENVGHPFASIFMAPADVSARFMRITLVDPYNAAGHVQLGRVFAGLGVQPRYNMSYGMGDSWETLSQVETSLGGTDFFDERRSYRVAQFTLDHLDQQTEFKQFYEMQRRQGITGEVLYIPDGADMAASQLTGFVGRMRKLAPFEYPFCNTRKLAFEIKEII